LKTKNFFRNDLFCGIFKQKWAFRYVDEVLVRDIQTNQLFFFLPNRWLAANKADMLLSAEISVASVEDLTSFRHRFTCLNSRGLRDSHLYFSVLFRPSRSTFTRAQRLTCILSLLLTTMLASIMFFQIDEPIKEPKDQRSFRGFTFNWTQIKLGLQSGLMVLPVNLAVIQCFINAAPKKGAKKVERG
jgi:polycystin 1L2